MAGGDFQITALPDVKVRLDQMFADSRVKRFGVYDPVSLNAIAENQMVKVDPILSNGRDCRKYEVYFKKPNCDDEAVDCTMATDLCDFDADPTVELEKVEITINNCIEDKFSIQADICEDSNMTKFADKFAMELNDVFLKMERKMNKVAIAFLEANQEAPVYHESGVMTVDAQGIYIAPNLWKADLMADLQQFAMMNRINEPVFLNGLNLWKDLYKANMGASANEETQRNLFNSFRNWYWDYQNLDQQLNKKATFLWDAGSLALLNESYHPSMVPTEVTADKHIYHINHPRLMYRDGNTMKPMVIDVTRIRKCTTTEAGVIAADYLWHFRLRFEFLTAPTACDDKIPLFKFLNETVPVTP